MHRITIDRPHALVSMIVDGFFGAGDLAAAAGDLHAAIRSLGPRVGQHVTLYDMTGLKVVPQAVLDGFANYFSDPAIAPLWARRVALVCRSALVSRQMERVARSSDALRVFQDRRDALTWLLADRQSIVPLPV